MAVRTLPWRDPVEALAPFAEEPWTVLLLSDGGPQGRWSYLALDPDRTDRLAARAGEAGDGLETLRDLLAGDRPAPSVGPDAPSFTGGVIGLATYEYGDRLEPLDLPRDPDWPDLELARYPALLAFDHILRRVLAVGRDAAQAARAAGWLAATAPARGAGPPAETFAAEAPPEVYEAAVADVVARIGAGEIFQANVAQAWGGRLRPGARPFDVFARLAAGSPAPFSAYWRLPGRALVSHSPERFLRLEADGRVETRPIKGTRPRGADAAEDARLARELQASAKDRAENLMIVDLMRNDLARVCAPGSVAAPELFAVESYPNVHHLVSAVTGRLAVGRDGADLLHATFPPGSITGAPKVQAMKVIAAHERPRGPWCGSLFRAGFDGGLDSSVLIRTAAFVETAGGWRYRACAGAGIVADSDPHAERLETEAKIAGLRRALTEAEPR